MPKAYFQYEIIAEDLRQNIHNGKYAVGSRLPPEPDLARIYGVNHLTLRKALALVQAGGLLDRHPGRGTFILAPPAPLPKVANGTVLFIGRTQGHLNDRLYQAVVNEAQARGRSVYPFNALAANGPEVMDAIQRLLADGTPVLASEGMWADLIRHFPDVDCPRIHVGMRGEAWPWQPGHHVVCDLLRAGLLATRHLLRLGHRRIAFIGAHPQDGAAGTALPEVKNTHLAYEGYRFALAEAGLTGPRSLGYYDAGVDQRGLDIDREFLDQLDGWATAFVCDSDFRLVTLCQVLQERGLRVPQDVSLVGMGNTPWCQAGGSGFDSVDLAVDELASMAVRLCLSPPAAPAEPVFVHVNPRLVVRTSSGPSPAGA